MLDDIPSEMHVWASPRARAGAMFTYPATPHRMSFRHRLRARGQADEAAAQGLMHKPSVSSPGGAVPASKNVTHSVPGCAHALPNSQ